MNNNGNNRGGWPSGHKNGDAKSKKNRPLKKARFAWQVKGKHHLKTDSNKNNNNEPSTARVNTHINNCVPREMKYPETECNYGPFTSVTINEFNMIKTSEAVIESSCNECQDKWYRDGGYSFPLCTHPLEHENTASNSTNSTAKRRPYYKDEFYLREWQALQESKCLLDNLVNKVLDTWTSNPLFGDGLERSVGNFVNNMGNNEVVNEGILMAISAHGLQNAPDSDDCTDTPAPNAMEVMPSTSNSYNDEGRMPSTSNSYNDEGSSTSQIQDVTQQLSSASCLQEEEDYVTDNLNSSIDYDLSSDNIIGNDFLDTAVEFAIQNKGLTSTATEFG